MSVRIACRIEMSRLPGVQAGGGEDEDSAALRVSDEEELWLIAERR